MSDKAYTASKSRRTENFGAADFVVDINKKALPELLAPAGSPRALEAAIEGGADAVYFGGMRHNARASAVNFTAEDLPEHVATAHTYGVKMYQTLNTLATDRELSELIEDATVAYNAGVDALIVADLGVAAAIHRALPDLALHASTQASGHSVQSAKQLEKLGFSRMVCAREMSCEDIRTFTANSPLEAEVFIHGALCVCHSGQCLFSSLVGGRSGNRGECAQPCRLPFRTDKKNKYPLSLKDLSLARHIPALIDAGVSSLKIEGRMKSPEYVLAVTQVFRRLLDERRGATDAELAYLASIFSRDGFTDGYFTRKIGSHMLGVRREEDKSASRALPEFKEISRRIPITMNATILRGEPMRLYVSDGVKTVEVCGDMPEDAIKVAADRETVLRNLTKLGGTPYSLKSAELCLDEGLSVPLSKLNALRRDAITALSAQTTVARTPAAPDYTPATPSGKRQILNTARFYSPDQISPSAQNYFDILYLPLQNYDSAANGVILPPVIFDSERVRIREMLKKAVENGARHALVGNIGHVDLAKEFGLEIHGDFRLNVTNTQTVGVLESLGVEDVILSPELTLPQLRDIRGNTAAIVYGRIPLMVLEKCIGKDIADCNTCNSGKMMLTDRRGVSFPVLREQDHRSVIYNSLPTGMSDRAHELDRAGITNRHFIFSVETSRQVDAVINAYKHSDCLPTQVRRI